MGEGTASSAETLVARVDGDEKGLTAHTFAHALQR